MTGRGEPRLKCKCEGCSAQEHSREGYCARHVKQLRAGLEMTQAKDFSGFLPWLEEQVGAETQDCIMWPHSRNKAGYGQVRFRGKQANAHRAMCVLVHGEPPFEGAEAAHECGNNLCVNPRHLSWKTGQANNMDKLKHGTMPVGERHWNSRLTDSQVRALREFAHTVKDRGALGEMFGISRSATYNLLRHNARAV